MGITFFSTLSFNWRWILCTVFFNVADFWYMSMLIGWLFLIHPPSLEACCKTLHYVLAKHFVQLVNRSKPVELAPALQGCVSSTDWLLVCLYSLGWRPIRSQRTDVILSEQWNKHFEGVGEHFGEEHALLNQTFVLCQALGLLNFTSTVPANA